LKLLPLPLQYVFCAAPSSDHFFPSPYGSFQPPLWLLPPPSTPTGYLRTGGCHFLSGFYWFQESVFVRMVRIRCFLSLPLAPFFSPFLFLFFAAATFSAAPSWQKRDPGYSVVSSRVKNQHCPSLRPLDAPLVFFSLPLFLSTSPRTKNDHTSDFATLISIFVLPCRGNIPVSCHMGHHVSSFSCFRKFCASPRSTPVVC